MRQHPLTLTDLGVRATANAINERGQITGQLQVGPPPSGLPLHAFLRTGGQVHDLGVLGGQVSEGLAVNDRGHVVGMSSVDGDWTEHAALWRDGRIIDIGPGRSLDVNNLDQVVGFTPVDGQDRPFLWENGTRTLLETPQGATGEAVAINDRGDIVGSVFVSGVDEAFVPPAPRICPDGPC